MKLSTLIMSLKRLINLGVRPEDTPIENRKIKLLNVVLLVVIVFLLFYVVYNLFNGLYTVAYFEVGLLGIYSTLFYFQYKGRTAVSRDVLIFSLQFFICLYMLYLRPGNMGEYVLFLVLFLQLVFYQDKRILIPLYLFNLVMFYVPQLLLHPYPDENFSFVNPLINFVAIPILVYYFYDSLSKSETEIYQKNQALKQLIKERAKLVGIMAHDLKSPLSRIEGITNILESNKLSSEQTELIHMIKKVSQDQSEMIQKVLSLQAEDSSDSIDQMHLSDADIIPICRETLQSFQFKAREKGITLVEKIEDEKIEAMIEPTFFKSVVENLLSNAVKYCEFSNEINFKLHKNDEYVHLEVSDNGPGITKKDQKKLFIPGAMKSEDSKDSSGLGLSIVQFYMQKMGGKISCDSEPGKGSTFTAYFKKAEVKEN
jgi:signal transduction histidine kinase